MKDIKDIINLIKTNNYARILIELFLGIGLFNVNTVFAIIFTIIIAIEVIFANIEDTLLIYLFLSFFDEVLTLEILKGSIVRVLMVIIIIKAIVFIIKNKIKPNKYHIAISIFFLVSCIVGIITYRTINLEVVITIINVFVLLILSMCISISDREKIQELVKKSLYTIVFAVLGCILYGACTNNFMSEYEGEKISYRFKGTYEPNFMSMFINLGIISLLFLKEDIKRYRWFAILSFTIMIIAIIATVSMTGLIATAVILAYYIIVKRKKLRYEIKSWVIVGTLIVLIFAGIKLISNIEIKNNINNIDNIEVEENDTVEIDSENNGNGLINRLEFLKQKLTEGDWDRISSGRLPIIRNFIHECFNRPLGNILFGNDMSIKKIYTQYMGKMTLAHCTYIDFLYNFGICGSLLIVGYVFIITKKNIFLGQDITNIKYKNAIKLIRILLLIYAITLSLYSKRLILIFFLL